MRATCLHEIGGSLQLETVPDPTRSGRGGRRPGLRLRQPPGRLGHPGERRDGRHHLPWIPGTEGTGYLDGRPVMVSGAGVGVLRAGLYRERATVPSAAVTEVPEGVDLVQAAAIGVTGVTAWSSLYDRAQFTPRTACSCWAPAEAWDRWRCSWRDGGSDGVGPDHERGEGRGRGGSGCGTRRRGRGRRARRCGGRASSRR